MMQVCFSMGLPWRPAAALKTAVISADLTDNFPRVRDFQINYPFPFLRGSMPEPLSSQADRASIGSNERIVNNSSRAPGDLRFPDASG
jgi:hypothetical protein